MTGQPGRWSRIKCAVRWLARRSWCWGKVLVVCRVPLFSAVAGGLVLNFSQAEAFFADLGLLWWQWAVFFVLLFGWAWIVHAVARRALQHDDWVIEAHVDGGLTELQRLMLREEFARPRSSCPGCSGCSFSCLVAWGDLQRRGQPSDGR